MIELGKYKVLWIENQKNNIATELSNRNDLPDESKEEYINND